MKSITPTLIKTARHIMLIFISLVLTGVLVLGGLLLAWSYPGKPPPFLNPDATPLANSLSEKIWVDINGVQQGMFIQSKNISNPVLLFLHGGPGMPEFWLTDRYPNRLADHFTVVWWDQRGAGLSYHPDIAPETMTEAQFISDTLAVTHYLRQRFGKDKIYLMAHSWGSYIGIQAAARAPELYHAYIGMGQIAYQIQSEQIAYAYALNYYRQIGDSTMVRRMEAAPPTTTTPLPKDYDLMRDDYMHGAGIGTTHSMKSVVTGIFLPSWQFRAYTLAEKINLWRGKSYSRSSQFNLWDKMQMTDLSQQLTQVNLPVYFLHGVFDYTCAYPLAKTYFENLSAPLKGFYTFNDSAHSPLFEEPDRVVNILVNDVLNGSKHLADQP